MNKDTSLAMLLVTFCQLRQLCHFLTVGVIPGQKVSLLSEGIVLRVGVPEGVLSLFLTKSDRK